MTNRQVSSRRRPPGVQECLFFCGDRLVSYSCAWFGELCARLFREICLDACEDSLDNRQLLNAHCHGMGF